MKIGNLEFPLGLSLAPMAGFSDRSMRLLCHRYGAEYSVSEMISATAVTFGDKKTAALARIDEDEGPVGLQLFGSKPEVMAEAAKIIIESYNHTHLAFIDINMGCPVHKIFSNGEGSALMREPSKIEKIVNAVKTAVSIPVTVKIRTGIDENNINAVDCAIAAEAGGADALCIHGRTRKQMYSGTVDRETIGKVKKYLHIPVIANGDINTAEDAVTMLSETGADGIAIGRGAVGNPFLFDEISCILSGKEYTRPTLDERIETALLQLRIAVEDKGERIAVTEARKQIALYLKGFKGASAVRGEINKALTYKEVEKIFLSLKN